MKFKNNIIVKISIFIFTLLIFNINISSAMEDYSIGLTNQTINKNEFNNIMNNFASQFHQLDSKVTEIDEYFNGGNSISNIDQNDFLMIETIGNLGNEDKPISKYVSLYRGQLFRSNIDKFTNKINSIKDKLNENGDLNSFKKEMNVMLSTLNSYLNRTYKKEVSAIKKINKLEVGYRKYINEKYKDQIEKIDLKKANELVKRINIYIEKREKSKTYFSEKTLKEIAILSSLKDILLDNKVKKQIESDFTIE